MKLKEFLEKFCEIQKIDKKFFGMFNDVHSGLVQLDLFKKYFPEAMQNLADKICKKQRENCYNAFPDKLGDWLLNRNLILNAEQPKIEDL